MIFSEEYFKTIELYKKLHSSGTTKLPPQKTFAGYSLIKWIPEIHSIIKINKANKGNIKVVKNRYVKNIKFILIVSDKEIYIRRNF